MTAVYIHKPYILDEHGYTRCMFVMLPRSEIRSVRISGGQLEIILLDGALVRLGDDFGDQEFPNEPQFFDDITQPEIDIDVTWAWDRRAKTWDRREHHRPTKENP